MDGEYTRRFENWLKNRLGVEYATVVHSGTQALEFIAEFWQRHWEFTNIKSTVRIPNFTYPATLNAFVKSRYDIIIADTDKYGLMNPDYNFCSKLGNFECLVGLYGAPPTIDDSTWHSAIVDGAQHWLAINSPNEIGLAMAISFDPTKNLNASGNGGAVVTNDRDLMEFVTSYKNNGKPEHIQDGTNSKMSELDCAHLLVRTKYIESWQHRRSIIRKYYIKQFEDLPVRCLSKGFEVHADQKFVIYTEYRDELYKFLHTKGIEAKIHYPYTLSELPVTDGYEKPTLLSVSTMLSRGVLSLPIYPELSDGEVDYIATMVKQFFDKTVIH